MSETTLTYERKTEGHETTHAVTLTNGEILLIQEDSQCKAIGIALGESDFKFEADVWICNITANGVQVLPNSSYGPETLSNL